MPDDSDIVSFLKSMADASAAVILPHFANPELKVEWKADQTPVTYADRKAEEVMRGLISKAFPAHGVLGEEFPADRPDAEYCWILDPIDGTKAFAAGCPLFGTLICLSHRGQPIWGAIHLPVTRQLFIGNNISTWYNDRLVRLPDPPALQAALVCTTDPKSPPLYHPAAGWQALVDAAGQFRSWGDCFGYTLLLTGGAHAMLDPILNLWDVAALLPVLKGAGAIATSWSGADPLNELSMVAAHPRLHPELIRILNPA